MEQASDPVKDRIVKAFPEAFPKIDNINNLMKVVSHEKKELNELGPRSVFKLENGKQVSYNIWVIFYTVSKKNNNEIGTASVQNEDDRDKIDNGTIFDDYDLYVDISESKRHVFDIKKYVSTTMGGSRKKYRKSSRRGKSAKKSSRTRKFRNRK
jgi:hypothetical protein